MQGVTAIVFDLDNTLVDRDAAVASWLRTLLAEDRVEACLRLDAGGNGARDAFFAAVAAASGLSEMEVRTCFREELPRHIRPMTGARALLERLSAKHRIAIATNGSSRMQRAKLSAAELGIMPDAVVISQEIGVEKPAAAFFDQVLAALTCAPAAALMVGDHPVNDIAGAASIGMRTCWLRSAHFAPPTAADACIDRLDQFPCL